MRLEIISAGSSGAGAVNEDAVGYCSQAAWVLDGATGLGGPFVSEKSDAHWFAASVAAGLGEAFDAATAVDTADIVAHVLAPLEHTFLSRTTDVALQRHELPAAAFCMARLFGAQLELSWAADCKAYRFHGDALVEMVGGGPLEMLDNTALAELRALLEADPQLSLEAGRNAIRSTLIRHRSLMNAPDGYSVLTPAVSSAAGLSHTRAPVQNGEEILLASDGFYCLWESYRLDALPVALKALREGRGEDVLQMLRAIERADPNGRNHTRFKVHDDASWILARVVS